MLVVSLHGSDNERGRGVASEDFPFAAKSSAHLGRFLACGPLQGPAGTVFVKPVAEEPDLAVDPAKMDPPVKPNTASQVTAPRIRTAGDSRPPISIAN